MLQYLPSFMSFFLSSNHLRRYVFITVLETQSFRPPFGALGPDCELFDSISGGFRASKMDKTTILKSTIHFLRQQNEKQARADAAELQRKREDPSSGGGRLQSLNQDNFSPDIKPPFLSTDAFTRVSHHKSHHLTLTMHFGHTQVKQNTK